MRVMRIIGSAALLTLAACAPRHPLEDSWHNIKWHRERPNVVYGAQKEHDVLVIPAKLERSYIDYCLGHFVRDLRRHSPEHAKMIGDWERDLSPELTRAVQETGGAFLIVGDDRLDHIRINFSTFKHERYDFVCSSEFWDLFCRFSDRTCGDVEGLRRNPAPQKTGK